jgi:hypothetical protein
VAEGYSRTFRLELEGTGAQEMLKIRNQIAHDQAAALLRFMYSPYSIKDGTVKLNMSRVVVATPTYRSLPDVTALVQMLKEDGALLHNFDPNADEERFDLKLFPGIDLITLRKVLTACNSLDGIPGAVHHNPFGDRVKEGAKLKFVLLLIMRDENSAKKAVLSLCAIRHVIAKVCRYIDYIPDNPNSFKEKDLNDRLMAVQIQRDIRAPLEANKVVREFARCLDAAASKPRAEGCTPQDVTSSYVHKDYQPKAIDAASAGSPGFSKFTTSIMAAASGAGAGAGAGASKPKALTGNARKAQLAQEAAAQKQQERQLAAMVPKVTASNMSKEEQANLQNGFADLVASTKPLRHHCVRSRLMTSQ